MIGILLLILGLTMVNGFFAAAEMALVSVNPGQLHKLKQQNVKHAKTLESVTKDSTKYLSTIQVAITFAGFLSSAFAGSQLSDHVISWLASFNIVISEQVMVIIITVLLSYFTLVFGELVPKRIALAKSTSFALFSAPVVNVVMKIFRPFVWLLSISTSGVLKLLRIKTNTDSESITESDVKEMIVYGNIKGLYPKEERHMLERIFQLDDLTAGMIMTPLEDAMSINLNDIDHETLDELILSRFSRIPVFEGKQIKGVLLVKDILIELEDHLLDDIDISKHIHSPLIISEDLTINLLLSQMRSLSEHMAFVTDDQSEAIGIVTMEDIIEEIVGNIYDEHDDQKIKNTYKEDPVYIIAGDMSLAEIEHKIGMTLFNTENKSIDISTYIINELGSVPKSKSQLKLDLGIGYFDVLRVNKKSIKQLRLVLNNINGQ